VAGANVTVKTALFNVVDATGQAVQVTIGGAMGPVKALRWTAGTIEADSVASLTVVGRKATAALPAELPGDLGANLVLHGTNLAAGKPALGTVQVAHDLTGSIWQVNGPIAAVTVIGTAKNSKVRAAGSIVSLTLGASDGSTFLAGVTADDLDPTQVTTADLRVQASLGTVSIKGWTVASGQPIPDFLTNSSFLAPSLGLVNLLNSEPGTWYLFAQAGPADLAIKKITHKDTREPADTSLNWTWTPGSPIPPGGVDAILQIV
jgi:hypothetical protein